MNRFGYSFGRMESGDGRIVRFAVLAVLGLLAASGVRPASAEPEDRQDLRCRVGEQVRAEDRHEVHRIVVQQGVPEQEAQDFKLHMEGLGYVPVLLGDVTDDGKATVFYGNFANKTEAEKARAELRRSSISSIAVVSVERPDGASASRGSFTIVVADFRRRSEADALARRLAAAGLVGAKVVSQWNAYYVTFGEYPSREVARNFLASLKNEGHDRAEVVERGEDGALRVVPSASAGAVPLSEEQKKEVARLFQEKLALARSRAAARPPDVCKLPNPIDYEAERLRREAAALRYDRIAALIRDADAFMKAENYDEAIGSLDRILEIEPYNSLARMRKQTAEQRKAAAVARRPVVLDHEAIYRGMKSEASRQAARGDRIGLELAKGIWTNIKGLDASYEPEATAAIAAIDVRMFELDHPGPRWDARKSLALGIAGAILSAAAMAGAALLRRRRRLRS